MATLADLRNQLDGGYAKKQLHPLPDMPVVVRETLLLDAAKGKTILDIGASGPMHAMLCVAAKKVYGIDRPQPGVSDYLPVSEDIIGVDLDRINGDIPQFPGVELIICGEVIEHLSNPGHFLDRLRAAYKGIPVIITVPNAFAGLQSSWLRRGIENVNLDHVAWYSPRTLRTLVERAGYAIEDLYWYKGKPGYAEGIIAVVR